MVTRPRATTVVLPNPRLLSLFPIVETFKDEAFPGNYTEEEWKAVADKFNTNWNFPHCIGALDGKHVAIKNPRHSGSQYFNYERFYSIPFMTLVDANYRILWIHIGARGCHGDAQIWLESDLRAALESDTLGQPPPSPLTDHPDDNIRVPYYILGDNAFALKRYCMNPFSRDSLSMRELVFNYRLSRARRVVENTFGIMAMRFRVLLKTIELKPENVCQVIKCVAVLHNMLLTRSPPARADVDREDENHDIIPGRWRDQVVWDDVHTPAQQSGGRPLRSGAAVHDTLADYFESPAGIVPWQWEKAKVRTPFLADPEGAHAHAAALESQHAE